jgi:hypothetical protein
MEAIIDESEEYLDNKNINTQLATKTSPKMIFMDNKIPT